MTGQQNRLDSWKAISEYLGRDVRTAMRWAKSQGLPVRRVAGGRGRSVFAFAHEIDDWLAGQRRASDQQPADAALPGGTAQATKPEWASGRQRRVSLVVATVIVIGAVGVTLVLALTVPTDPRDLRAAAVPEGITLTGPSGAPTVIYRFAGDIQSLVTDRNVPVVVRLVPEQRASVIAGVSYYEDSVSKVPTSGELLHLSLRGDVLWRAPARHSLRFRNETFDDTFAISAWHVSPENGAPRQIAVAAHEWKWWASPVTIVDHAGETGPSFVNAGWVESLAWRDTRYLMAAGFNNPRDAAAVMLLDTQQMHGQTPGTAGTEYECLSCGPHAPAFYATMPRSELNRVTGARFNRAQVDVASDRITVTTIEIPAIAEPATAIYEFSLDLQLRAARYSVSYWDWHRRLEAEGRLTHTRDACPEKDGPPLIEVWDAARRMFVARRP